MLTAEARIRTERPRRYLEQLFRHASRMGSHPPSSGQGHTDTLSTVQHAEWSETYGTARTSAGRWSAWAGTDVLTVRAEATDPTNLSKIMALVTRRLETIGRRDGLKVSWMPTDGDSCTARAKP